MQLPALQVVQIIILLIRREKAEFINRSTLRELNYIQTAIDSLSCTSVQPTDLFRLWAGSHQVQSFANVHPVLLQDVVLPRAEFMNLAIAQILRQYLPAVVNGG